MKHTTTNFYVPPDDIRKGIVHFSEEESSHLVKVLRAKPDDEVVVVNGCGSAYCVKIIRADSSHSRGEIIGDAETAPEPNINHTLAVGAIHPKRLEAAWDSCVQLGLSRLVALHTEYSIERFKPDGKCIERLRAVSLRAMKQCRRAVLPEVAPPTPLVEILNSGEFRYILVGDPEGLPNPPHEKPKLGERVLLLVGPEGGFSAEERRLIANAGGVPISLGPRRLRAETATIALSVIALRWTADM